jgi:hypothetical protein
VATATKKMVFIIERHGTRRVEHPLPQERASAVSHKNEPENFAAFENADSAVVSMYESFIPWLSPSLIKTLAEESDLKMQQNMPEEEARAEKYSSNTAGKSAGQSFFWRWLGLSTPEKNPTVQVPAEESDSQDRTISKHQCSFPQEVHSLAKFHLCCRQAKRHVGNIGRVANVYNADVESRAPKVLACFSVGMGVLLDICDRRGKDFAFNATTNCEESMARRNGFQPSMKDEDLEIETLVTSDKQELERSAADASYIPTNSAAGSGMRKKSKTKSFVRLPPHLPMHQSHMRVASLGPSCRCVSWGFDDGVVGIYQRFQRGQDKVWNLVARIVPGAKNEVQRIKFISREMKIATMPCPSLARVSDLCPVFLPFASELGSSNPRNAIALLLISRIGGSIEIVPVGATLWQPSHSTIPEKSKVAPAIMTISTDCDFVKVVETRPHQLDVNSIDTRITVHPSLNRGKFSDNITLSLVASGTSTDPPYAPVINLWEIHPNFSTTALAGELSSLDVKFVGKINSSRQALNSSCRLVPVTPCCSIPADATLLKRFLEGATDKVIRFPAPIMQIKLAPTSKPHQPDDFSLLIALNFYGALTLSAFKKNAQNVQSRVVRLKSKASTPFRRFTSIGWILPTCASSASSKLLHVICSSHDNHLAVLDLTMPSTLWDVRNSPPKDAVVGVRAKFFCRRDATSQANDSCVGCAISDSSDVSATKSEKEAGQSLVYVEILQEAPSSTLSKQRSMFLDVSYIHRVGRENAAKMSNKLYRRACAGGIINDIGDNRRDNVSVLRNKSYPFQGDISTPRGPCVSSQIEADAYNNLQTVDILPNVPSSMSHIFKWIFRRCNMSLQYGVCGGGNALGNLLGFSKWLADQGDLSAALVLLLRYNADTERLVWGILRSLPLSTATAGLQTFISTAFLTFPDDGKNLLNVSLFRLCVRACLPTRISPETVLVHANFVEELVD